MRLAQRAQIVLRAAAGERNKLIAEELGVTEATVGKCRNSFAAHGLTGIEEDRPRGGRKPRRHRKLKSKIIKKTTPERPANANSLEHALARRGACTPPGRRFALSQSDAGRSHGRLEERRPQSRRRGWRRMVRITRRMQEPHCRQHATVEEGQDGAAAGRWR